MINPINNPLTLKSWAKNTLRHDFTAEEKAAIEVTKIAVGKRFDAFMEEVNG